MNFTTIKNVVDRKAATLLKSLRSIKSVYTDKNIFITILYMDNWFEVLHNALRDEGLAFNTTAADEQVPQIERQIEVVKKWDCSTWRSLPCGRVPSPP